MWRESRNILIRTPVTDGSAVLGIGNIGPRAAMPVMEGKAILFQTFAGVEAFPICRENRWDELDQGRDSSADKS